MTDTISPEKRSWVMSRVTSKNTSPEKRVRSMLHKMGYRFRLHYGKLPGKPDIVLPKHSLAIFVHGCFWHRHPGCPANRTPKSNVDFWTAKFERNVERDKKNQAELKALGWRVEVIWECETKNDETLRRRIEEIFSKPSAVVYQNASDRAAVEKKAAEKSDTAKYGAQDSGGEA